MDAREVANGLNYIHGNKMLHLEDFDRMYVREDRQHMIFRFEKDYGSFLDPKARVEVQEIYVHFKDIGKR